MSFEGMDVDQLQGLAKQVNSDAEALYNLVTSLTGVIGRLTYLWNGPVAATFEQDWQSKNRPALLAAHNILTSLHAHLVDNINQQVSASAAEGGWTAERVAGDAENVLTAIGLAGIPIGLISELGEAPKDVTGWKQVLSYATDDHLFGLSPDGVGWVKSAAGFFEKSHVDDGLKVLGLAGSAIGVYHVVEDSYHAEQDFSEGNYVGAANEFADGVSDGLKAYPSPVTYLAGVDVKLLDQVANLDWKDTPNPLSGSNFKQDYLPVFQSMGTGAFWGQAAKTLWGDM